MTNPYELPPHDLDALLGNQRTLHIVRAHKINALNYHHSRQEIDLLAKQRRFGKNIVITSNLPNEAMPKDIPGLSSHFRIVLIPHDETEPTGDIEKMTLRYPILDGEPNPEAGDDNGVKDVFVELSRGNFVERYLLNGNGLQAYRDGSDIREASPRQQLHGNLCKVVNPLPPVTEAQKEANNNLFAVVSPSLIKVDEKLEVIGSLLTGPNTYQYQEQDPIS